MNYERALWQENVRLVTGLILYNHDVEIIFTISFYLSIVPLNVVPLSSLKTYSELSRY